MCFAGDSTVCVVAAPYSFPPLYLQITWNCQWSVQIRIKVSVRAFPVVFSGWTWPMLSFPAVPGRALHLSWTPQCSVTVSSAQINVRLDRGLPQASGRRKVGSPAIPVSGEWNLEVMVEMGHRWDCLINFLDLRQVCWWKVSPKANFWIQKYFPVNLNN